MSTPTPPPPYEPGPPPFPPPPPAFRSGASSAPAGPPSDYPVGMPVGHPAAPQAVSPQGPAAPPPRSGGPERPPTSRLGLWLTVGAGAFVLVVAAVVIALQVSANGAYDSALDAWRDATDETTAAQATLSSEATVDADAVTDAQAIVAASADGIVDTALRDEVSAAATTLEESATAATDEASSTAPDSPGARPTVFWELFGAATALRGDVAELADERGALSEASDALAADAQALDDTAADLYLSTSTAGPAFEVAHVNARNAEVIAFRDAQQAVSEASGVGADALDAMTTYSAAAQGILTSEQEELASISDGLYANRLAAQDFARSIDGGVLVEFDWAPIVYGAGEGGSVGGYTTWNYDHGGHAVIQLSNSVAELWPADVTLNLIAHEVGHAISAKCYDLYDDTDQQSIELFATAWAISMGYTGDGNGVSLYGQPSPELIASAATCR